MAKISIENFDEVKLHLRTELGKLADNLEKTFSKSKKESALSIEVKDLDNVKNALLGVIRAISEFEFNPTFNVNVPDLEIPEIKIPDISVPTPIVNVEAPSVNVEAPNLDRLLRSLDNLKYLSDRADKPLAVRMSDGQKFIKALQSVQKSAEKLNKSAESMGVVFAGSSGLSTDDMRNLGLAVSGTVGDGSKTVTTAGTRVQLVSSSVNCRKVKVIALEANIGTIWVGGSTVASGRGEPLVAQQSTDWIETNNVSNIYIDSTVNAEGVSFIYV